MAVAEQTPYIEYIANGATTNFPLGFYCDNKDHLIVTVGGVESLFTGWELLGSSVVFDVAPLSESVVVIQRNTPFERNTDYQTYNNSFRPQAVNKELDRIWLKLQELGFTDLQLGNRINDAKAFLLAEIEAQGISLDQLDEYYNYLMQRLAQIAIDKGWDASFVVDGDKTQKQINNLFFSAVILPQMYGAVGDGIVNDTNAFTNLEIAHQGENVDLQGKTYFVNSLPTQNIYNNGYFSLNGKLLISNGSHKNSVLTALKTPLDRVDAIATIAPSVPDFANTFIQSAAKSGEFLYTLQDNRNSTSDPSYTLISKFSISGDTLTYVDSMLPSAAIGHQSLAIDSDGKLWSRGIDGATGVVRFSYVAGAAPVVENFVISDRIVDITISTDGKWLIGRGGYESNGASIQTFIIYDFEKLKNGGAGNYIGQHSYYFEAQNSSNTVQSSQMVLSDGKYIYLLRSGTKATTPSLIYVYDFNGNFIESFNFNVGRAGILSRSTVYEPQWIDARQVGNSLEVYAGVSSGKNKIAASNYVFNLSKAPAYKSGQVDNCIGSSIGIGTDNKLSIDEYIDLALNIKAPSRDLSSAGMLCTSSTETSQSALVFGRSLAENVDGTHVPVTLGTNIARIVGKSAVSSGVFSTSAGIYMQIDAAPSADFAPANVTIYTYDAVSNTNAARLKVNSNGSVDFTPPSTTEYAAKFSRQLTGDFLQFDIQGYRVGSIYSTSATFYIAGRNGKNLAFGFSSTESGSVSARLILNGDGSAFRPAVTNSLNLGEAAFAFKNGYFQNAPIITSDERQKQQFRSLDELEKAAALEIRSSICLFKFNDAVDLKGDGARWHVGVKAQQVISILESHGLNPFDYGFVCFDEWGHTDAVIDDKGEIVEPEIVAGSRYAIRYDELAMFILTAV